MNCLTLWQEEAQQRRERLLAWRVGEGGAVRVVGPTLAVCSESWWRHENLVRMTLRLSARAGHERWEKRRKRLYDGDDDHRRTEGGCIFLLGPGSVSRVLVRTSRSEFERDRNELEDSVIVKDVAELSERCGLFAALTTTIELQKVSRSSRRRWEAMTIYGHRRSTDKSGQSSGRRFVPTVG